VRNHPALFKPVEFTLLVYRLAVGMTLPSDSYKHRGP